MAKSIDIILNADDKFSKTFRKMEGDLRKTKSQLDRIKRSSQGAAGGIRGMGKAMLGMAGGVLIANSLGRAMSFVSDSLNDALGAAIAQERAEIRLNKAMQQTNDLGQESMKTFKDWATVLQLSTGAADDLSLEMAALGMSMGFGAKESQDLVEIAHGLSKEFGIDMKTAMKAAALAAEGNFTQLQRYIPSIRTATTATDKWAMVIDGANRGLEKAQEEQKGMGGSIEQVKMAFGDLLEGVVMQWSGHIVKMMQGLKVFINNIGTYWEIYKSYVGLALLTMFNDFVHTFTVQIPALFTWLFENAKTIFGNIFGPNGLILTLVRNVADGIINIFMSVWDWIANGFEGGLGGIQRRISESVTVGIMDGFQAAELSDLQIPDRQMSAVEKTMMDDIQRNWDKIDKAWAEATEVQAPIAGDTIAGPSEFKDDGSGGAQAAVMAAMGSAGGGERFLQSGRSISQSPEKETAKNTKMTSDGVNKMIEQQEVLNGNFEQFMSKSQGDSMGGV